MLKTGNKKYYNVKGIQINDPSINEDNIMEEGAFNTYQAAFGIVPTSPQLLQFGMPISMRGSSP
jgi:hypothetical protein